MSNKVRVLALNDDNHETTFHSEWRKEPFSTKEFLQKLAEPHSFPYEIRYVYLLDIDDNNPILNRAFDSVQSGGHHVTVDYFTGFENLWKISRKTMYGGW